MAKFYASLKIHRNTGVCSRASAKRRGGLSEAWPVEWRRATGFADTLITDARFAYFGQKNICGHKKGGDTLILGHGRIVYFSNLSLYRGGARAWVTTPLFRAQKGKMCPKCAQKSNKKSVDTKCYLIIKHLTSTLYPKRGSLKGSLCSWYSTLYICCERTFWKNVRFFVRQILRFFSSARWTLHEMEKTLFEAFICRLLP